MSRMVRGAVVHGDSSHVPISSQYGTQEPSQCTTQEPSPCITADALFEAETAYLRIAGIVRESIVDGPGIRFTVFTQGCKHHCPGCHNPQTHDFEGGKLVSIESILEQIGRNPLLDGVTLSGGEPFEQALACSELARKLHAMNLNVITYSGYTFEEILAGMAEKHGWRELLQETDILVDGRFVLARKNLLLKFRGSDNQRIIDVKRSLKAGYIVEWNTETFSPYVV